MSESDSVENFHNGLGLRIRQLRQSKGIKSQEFSEALEISRSYLSRIENGQRRVPTSLISKIAQYLEVPSDTLLTEPSDDLAYQPSLDDLNDQIKVLVNEMKASHALDLDFCRKFLRDTATRLFPRDMTLVSLADWEDFIRAPRSEPIPLVELCAEMLRHTALAELIDRAGPEASYSSFRARLIERVNVLEDNLAQEMTCALLPFISRYFRFYRRLLGHRILKRPKDPASATASSRHVRIPRGENIDVVEIADDHLKPRFMPGDQLLIDTRQAPKTGHLVVAFRGDKPPLVGFYTFAGGRVNLQPPLSQDQPLVLSMNDFEKIHPVVAVVSRP